MRSLPPSLAAREPDSGRAWCPARIAVGSDGCADALWTCLASAPLMGGRAGSGCGAEDVDLMLTKLVAVTVVVTLLVIDGLEFHDLLEPKTLPEVLTGLI